MTLTELLVVVAVIAVLAALLLPVLGRARAVSKEAVCLNNLRQIGVAVRLYADDWNDLLPPPATNAADHPFTAYAALVRGYLVAGTVKGPQKASVFACPADTFYYDFQTTARIYRISRGLHDQPSSDFSSYWFNAGNFPYGSPPVLHWGGVAGFKMPSIKRPDATLLIVEAPATDPYSWHAPAATPGFQNNARCMASFADGHSASLRMYWDAANAKGLRLWAWQYDPPPGYDYKWSAN